MRAITGADNLDDIPRQISCSGKDRRIDVRLQFPQGPALHYKEHLGTLDRHFSDFALISNHILVNANDA